MRRALLLLATLAVAGCGDNTRATTPDDGGVVDSATPDTGPTVLAPCLDRPDSLARPPAGTLPCELLPPGFAP